MPATYGDACAAVESLHNYLKLSNRIRHHTQLHFIGW